MTPEQLARKIKAELALRGITQASIALKVGKTRQHVTQVISGKSTNPVTRKAIAKAAQFNPWEEVEDA